MEIQVAISGKIGVSNIAELKYAIDTLNESIENLRGHGDFKGSVILEGGGSLLI